MIDIVDRLRDKHCCDDTCHCDEAADEIERLRAALEKHETRFNHCSEMIEQSFNISGTLRSEYARKAHHYALEARAALTAQPAAPGGDA